MIVDCVPLIGAFGKKSYYPLYILLLVQEYYRGSAPHTHWGSGSSLAPEEACTEKFSSRAGKKKKNNEKRKKTKNTSKTWEIRDPLSSKVSDGAEVKAFSMLFKRYSKGFVDCICLQDQYLLSNLTHPGYLCLIFMAQPYIVNLWKPWQRRIRLVQRFLTEQNATSLGKLINGDDKGFIYSSFTVFVFKISMV